jgi:predicted GIY-YIG superfamily endonuclease
MINDCLINQIGLISPPLRNAYLYKRLAALDSVAGILRMSGGFGLFCDVKNISYISGMIGYYTYKITNTNGEIVYVGYTKNPQQREWQHLQHNKSRFYDSSYKFEIVGEYPNAVIARYYEEKLKRELGLKGEMCDDRFTNHKKLFKVWWREING